MFVFSNCPTLTAWFDIDDKIEREILEVVLTKGIYPHGRCCQGIQPKLAAKYPVYELNAKAEETEGFKIFLFDKRHFSKFRESFFEFEGDHISIGSYKKGSEQNKGFQKYRVQMIEEHHLEDDPNFDCKVGSLLPEVPRVSYIYSYKATEQLCYQQRPLFRTTYLLLPTTNAWRRNTSSIPSSC